MKQITIFFLALVCISGNIFSQTHLSVDVNDPIYTLLEIAEIRGAITSLPGAKPYSLSHILALLRSAISHGENLLPSEIAIITRYLDQLNNPVTPPFYPAYSDEGSFGKLAAGLNEDSEINLNLNDLGAWHMVNAFRFYLKGDIGDYISFYGCFGGTIDKIGPDSFVPYSFTKKWDGFHIGFTDPRYSLTGIEPVPYFSFIVEDEATAQFFDDNLTLSFSRLRRDWGPGEGNLYLSKTARPYQGLDIHARFAPWCNLSWSCGSLNDWRRENLLINNTNTAALSYQKMLTIQMLEFYPFDWLYLSSVATAIWGKRFELSYLSPLLYPVIAQNTMGNVDNVSQAVNLMFFIPGNVKIYLSFLADEMEFTNLDEFFLRPRNMVAYQAGLRYTIPGIPLTLLTLQYTKVEPFVYAHYPETTEQPLGHPVDMSYTNDGENLGFNTPPNSDEILVRADTFFLQDFLFSLSYRLIRHGTSGGDPSTDHLIYGNVDIPFDYNNVDLYPNKNFLSDGIYDWNNIVTIGSRLILPQYRLALSLEYSFAYIFYVANSSGKPVSPNQFKNIVSLSISFAR